MTPTPADKKPAPRTRNTAPKAAAAPAPPPKPDYLTKQQIDWLLQGIEPYRVKTLAGKQNLQSYDVRNHLNEVFGFANWDGEVIDMALVFDVPRQLSSGKPGAYVCYRATYRLTVKALAGNVLATYTEVAAGDATMPANMRFEAHDFALKTAESQALKRAAINLGNQFGLSLYAKTQNSITRGTINYPEEMHLTPHTEPIAEEVDPDATDAADAAAAHAAAEAPQAPQTPPAPVAVPSPAPEPASVQQVPQPVSQPQTQPEPAGPYQTPEILEEIAGLQESLGWLTPEARAHLMNLWKKTTLPPLARIVSPEQIAQAWQLYDAVKPPPAQQQTSSLGNLDTTAISNTPPEMQQQIVDRATEAGNLALTQQRQAQIDQARAHFPNAPQQDDTPHGYSQEWPEQDNNEFYSQ